MSLASLLIYNNIKDYSLDVFYLNKVLRDMYIDYPLDKPFTGNYSTGDSLKIGLSSYFRKISKDNHLGFGNYLYRQNSKVQIKSYDADLVEFVLPRMRFSQDELHSIKSSIKKHNNLIFDLRGNQGGSIRHVTALFEFIENSNKEIDFEDGSIIPLFLTDLISFKYNDLTDIVTKDKKLTIKEKCKNKLCNYSPYHDEVFQLDFLELPRSKKNIYIIYDEKCSSACELFLIFSKSFKNSVTFSRSQSGGNYERGGSIIVELPVSGIQFYLPTTKFIFKDGPFRDYSPIKPKIDLNYFRSQRAIDIVQSYIKKHQN